MQDEFTREDLELPIAKLEMLLENLRACAIVRTSNPEPVFDTRWTLIVRPCNNIAIVGNCPVMYEIGYSNPAAVDKRTYEFIRAARSLGAKTLIMYMTATAVTGDLPDVVAISDQISLLMPPPHWGVDPGPGEEMFFPMNDAYDLETELSVLEKASLPQKSGVVLGVEHFGVDSFTRFEWAWDFGADMTSDYLVGQCLVAKRAGMRVIGFAEISPQPVETIRKITELSIEAC